MARRARRFLQAEEKRAAPSSTERRHRRRGRSKATFLHSRLLFLSLRSINQPLTTAIVKARDLRSKGKAELEGQVSVLLKTNLCFPSVVESGGGVQAAKAKARAITLSSEATAAARDYQIRAERALRQCVRHAKSSSRVESILPRPRNAESTNSLSIALASRFSLSFCSLSAPKRKHHLHRPTFAGPRPPLPFAPSLLPSPPVFKKKRTLALTLNEK